MLPETVNTLQDAGVATGSAWTLYRVFGPSIGAFGGNLGKWTDRWSQNFLRISERAEKKLGPKTEIEGEVSPRIIQRLVTDGGWCDDSVAQEYFAGLVASSRSEDGLDDSNLPTITMLAGLGSKDIRLHYLVYRSVRLGLNGGWFTGASDGRKPLRVFLPMVELARGMDTSVEDLLQALPGVVSTLVRFELLESDWAVGLPAHMKNLAPPDVDEPGMVVTPSWGGIDLAIKSDGAGTLAPAQFLFGAGWSELPEDVSFDHTCAVFPSAPKTYEALAQLRERVGFPGEVPEPGWSLPEPAGEPPA